MTSAIPVERAGVVVGRFTGVVDVTTGRMEIRSTTLDEVARQRLGLCTLDIRSDGQIGTNPPDSIELYTVDGSLASGGDCAPEPGRYTEYDTARALCGDVLVRNFYGRSWGNVWAKIDAMEPIGPAGYLVDGVPAYDAGAALAGGFGRWSYGTLGAGGSLTSRWVLSTPSGVSEFRFEGRVLAFPTELCDGVDNDCDGDIDEGCGVPPTLSALATSVSGLDAPWSFDVLALGADNLTGTGICGSTIDNPPLQGSPNTTCVPVPAPSGPGPVAGTWPLPTGEAVHLAGYAENAHGTTMTPPVTVQRSPDVPTGVSASDGASPNKITVTWAAVPGASGYRVYRNGAEVGDVAALVFEDTVFADSSVPNAPQLVSATTNDPNGITVSWSAPTPPTGLGNDYVVTAYNVVGESAQSTMDPGSVSAAPVIRYEVLAEGVWRDAFGTSYSWTDAPTGALAVGVASATRGSHASHVAVSFGSASLAAGPSEVIAVRAVNANGPGATASTTGNRGSHTFTTLQTLMEVSTDEEPEEFGSTGVSGATWNDSTYAPADGTPRFYRARFVLPGGQSVTSEPRIGWRRATGHSFRGEGYLWDVYGTVRDTEEAEGQLFVGGEFAYAGPRTGRLVQVSMTGTLNAAALPEVNGTVRAWYVDGATSKIYIGGDFTEVGGVARVGLARLNSDGTLDTGWTQNLNDGGRVHTISKWFTWILIGGEFSSVGGQARSNFAHLDGSSGAPLTPLFSFNGAVHAIEPLGDEVIVGGAFTTANGGARNAVATIDFPAEGIVDDYYQANFTGTVYALEMTTDGLVAGGQFTVPSQFPAGTRTNLARFDVDGQYIDGNFGGSGGANGAVHALLEAGGSLWVGGEYTTIGGFGCNRLARMATGNGSFTQCPSLGVASGPSPIVRTLMLDGTDVWVGGAFQSVGSGVDTWGNVARFNTTGTLYTNRPATSGPVYALAKRGGDLVMAGAFASGGGVPNRNLQVLNLDTGSAQSNVLAFNGAVHEIEIVEDRAYIVGAFTQAASTTRNRAAAVLVSNPSTLTTWNPNVSGTSVNALEFDFDRVYLGGDFTQVGGTSRNNLARVDVDAGALDSGFTCGTNGRVNALEKSVSTIYVGGAFNQLCATGVTNFGGVGSAGLAFVGNTNGEVHALQDMPEGLAVGGSFTQIGVLSRIGFALLSHETSVAIAGTPAVLGTIQDFAHTRDRLVVVGNISSVGGTAVDGLAVLDRDLQVESGFVPQFGGLRPRTADRTFGGLFVGGSFTATSDAGTAGLARLDLPGGPKRSPAWDTNGVVHDVVVHGDMAIVAGSFSSVGRPTGGLARFTTTQAPRPLPAVVGQVNAIVTDAAGGLIVGGSITQVGRKVVNNLFRISADGTIDPGFDLSVNGPVHALATVGGRLYVGGQFSMIGGQTRNNLAEVLLRTGAVTSRTANADGAVHALAVHGGRLLIGGVFANLGGSAAGRFAALELSDFTRVAGTMTASGGAIRAIATDGTRVVVGGSAPQFAGVTAIADAVRLDGTTLTAVPTAWLGSGAGSVFAIGISGSRVLIGGDFSEYSAQGYGSVSGRIPYVETDFDLVPVTSTASGGPTGTVRAIHGLSASQYLICGQGSVYGLATNTACFESDGAGALQAGTWAPGVHNDILAVGSFGTDYVIGGGFSVSGGRKATNLAFVDLDTGIPLGLALDTNAVVYGVAMTRGLLTAGGAFSQVNATGRTRIFRYRHSDGTLPTISATFDNTILDLEPFGTMGTVVAGGIFTGIAGKNYVRAVLSDGTMDVTFTANANGSVTRLRSVPATGGVVAVGNFTQIGGNTRSHIGTLSTTGSMILAHSPVFTSGTSPEVRGIESYVGTTVIAGRFATVSSVATPSLSRYSSGPSVAAWDPIAAESEVRALGVWGGHAIIAGTTSTLGGTSFTGIGAVSLDDDTNTPWVASYSANGVDGIVGAGSWLIVWGDTHTSGGRRTKGVSLWR